MDTIQLIKMLEPPTGKVDMVLDTDAFNEIDDQFAISYALRSTDRTDVKAIYAAPFWNGKSTGPLDGMEKSYDEILKIVKLAGREDITPNVFKGSGEYLKDEKTPVDSPAMRDLIDRARKYTSDNPLYVVAIGAITNVASAIIAAPDIIDKIVIVWLGGNALHMNHTREFNMYQDVAAARIIFGCGAPLVQLPCAGVVDTFRTTGPELDFWFTSKNPLADYLAKNTIAEAESYAKGKTWSRVIWDVTAVAFVCDPGTLASRLIPSPIPEYDDHYASDPSRHFIRYVYQIDRDGLMGRLVERIAKG